MVQTRELVPTRLAKRMSDKSLLRPHLHRRHLRKLSLHNLNLPMRMQRHRLSVLKLMPQLMRPVQLLRL